MITKLIIFSPDAVQVCYLLLKGASNALSFLPAHSLQHCESISLNRNRLIICLRGLKNTNSDIIFGNRHTSKKKTKTTVRIKVNIKTRRLCNLFELWYCLRQLTARGSLSCRSYSAFWPQAVRLSPGWLKSPGSSPHQSSGPAHLSPLKASLWGKPGVRALRPLCIKMSCGPQWASFPLTLVLTVTSTVTESRYGMTVTRCARPLMKSSRKRADWLPACLWGEYLMPICHQSLTVLTEPPPYTYTCTHTEFAHRVLFHSDDGQHFLTLKFQSDSKWPVYETFCAVRHFHMLLKCLSSRLYFDLHISYHFTFDMANQPPTATK